MNQIKDLLPIFVTYILYNEDKRTQKTTVSVEKLKETFEILGKDAGSILIGAHGKGTYKLSTTDQSNWILYNEKNLPEYDFKKTDNHETTMFNCLTGEITDIKIEKQQVEYMNQFKKNKVTSDLAIISD